MFIAIVSLIGATAGLNEYKKGSTKLGLTSVSVCLVAFIFNLL